MSKQTIKVNSAHCPTVNSSSVDIVGQSGIKLFACSHSMHTKRIRIFMQMQKSAITVKERTNKRQNKNCFIYIYFYHLNCRQAHSNSNSSSRSTFNEFVLSLYAVFCSLFYTQNLICTRVHFVFNSQDSLAVNGLRVGVWGGGRGLPHNSPTAAR